MRNLTDNEDQERVKREAGTGSDVITMNGGGEGGEEDHDEDEDKLDGF